MKLVFDRTETRCLRGRVTVDVQNTDGHGTDGLETNWTLVNDAGQPATVESVAVVWRITDVPGPVRMFRHGYQSWSPSGWASFDVDEDPSRAPAAIPLVVDMHHADPAAAERDELRSELVTALDDGSGDPSLVLGFLGGAEHDGTFRLRRRDRGLELWAEAFLGGIVVDPGAAPASALDRVLRIARAMGDQSRIVEWGACGRALPGRLVLLVPLLRGRDRA